MKSIGDDVTKVVSGMAEALGRTALRWGLGDLAGARECLLDLQDKACQALNLVGVVDATNNTKKVKLVYFKTWNGPRNVGGKYYAEGDYETTKDFHDMLDEVESMRARRCLPGVQSPHSDFHVLVEGDVPHLLLGDSVVRGYDR
ncbi:MAG: hypothetical protein QUS11_06610 [Candidatus Fermentibacter sp.]|nr:hypothetical protein [Candidatus Fermentibacter sp.]